MLRGVKPVVIAIIVQALVGLGPKAVKTPWLGLIALAALAASLAGLDPLSVVLICGAVRSMAALRQSDNSPLPYAGEGKWRWPLALLLLAACCILAMIHVPHFVTAFHAGGSDRATTTVQAFPGEIFLYFLKIGSVLYGSGYVLLAFLQGDLVPRWLTAKQLLDATSVGQVTPGPLFTTATFIGFLLGYKSGGAVGGWLVVNALLADQRFRDFKSYVTMLRFAVEDAVEIVGDNFKEIAFSLLDKKLNLPVTARGDSSALFVAAEHGRIDLLKFMLADERFNPCDLNNNAFKLAVIKGQTKAVELLLKDPRVNPKNERSQLNYNKYGPNFALIYAAQNNYREIVKLLLIDKRLSPDEIPVTPEFEGAIALIKTIQQKL